MAPVGDWFVWLVMAGRGFGKTRMGAEWVREIVEGSKTPVRIALVAETAADARDVIVEGESGIIAVSPPEFRPHYEPSKRRLTWPNGSTATTYSATDPDQLRGPQHHYAWCFIAGTQISASNGLIPVEDVRIGDKVHTREGLQPVISCASRLASVGRVRFSNGKELVGTAEHPVLTIHGWTRLSDLAVGDVVCAANVSNGAASAGIATTAVTTNIGALAGGAGKTAIGCTALFTRSISALSRKGMRFITSMAMWRTMRSAISTAFAKKSTAPFTGPRLPFRRLIGKGCPPCCGTAKTAERRWPAKLSARKFFAFGANKLRQIVDASQSATASTVAGSSPAFAASFAVSVVSTWEPAGQQRVFNLRVDNQPEYFANGILTHNCDEIAKYAYVEDLWSNLIFGLRLGTDPRALVTTTPRPIKLLRSLLADPRTVTTRGATYDNAANLAPSALAEMRRRYEGTRLGRQELDGEIIDDVPGALWARDMLDRDRIGAEDYPDLRRIVVAVDPPVTSGENADECGIVVAGIDSAGEGYVLADRSTKGQTPEQWARAAVKAYHEFSADRLVAEVNNGGELVEHVMRKVDNRISYRAVRASRGKVIRAEPVSALYEQGKVHHCGGFPELEDQMCSFTSDFDSKAMGYSPDRVDALVWALTDLMVAPREMTATSFRL